MNTDLVRKWIDDLRYGGHKQGKKFLHAGDSYCCLGRGIEAIYGPEVWGLDKDPLDLFCTEIYRPNIREHYSCHSLDSQERDILGLSSHDMMTLIVMNDDGKSFAEIADYIELYLEKYLENNIEKLSSEPVLA